MGGKVGISAVPGTARTASITGGADGDSGFDLGENAKACWKRRPEPTGGPEGARPNRPAVDDLTRGDWAAILAFSLNPYQGVEPDRKESVI